MNKTDNSVITQNPIFEVTVIYNFIPLHIRRCKICDFYNIFLN